jgi:hypothetical protein
MDVVYLNLHEEHLRFKEEDIKDNCLSHVNFLQKKQYGGNDIYFFLSSTVFVK